MRKHDSALTEESLDLLFALMHGGRVTEARVDAALAEVHLSSQKWFTLRRIVEAGGSMSLGQAAERLACARSNVTQLIDRLEREGLVRRVPDPIDRRSILAEITEEGRRRYDNGWRALGALEAVLAATFTPGERDELSRALGRLDEGLSIESE